VLTAKNAEALVKRLTEEKASKASIVRELMEQSLGLPYVYASYGQICTPEWRRSRIPYCPQQKYVGMINNNCPVLSGKKGSCAGCQWDGCPCFDCEGFLRWLFELIGVPFYGAGATTQWQTSSNWVAKGEISTLPRNLVCCVYKWRTDRMSHAGMSTGDGNGGVIHCSTIVQRGNAFTDPSPWTHWGIPAGLYSTEELKKAGLDVSESKNVPILRKGNSGPAVKVLQNLLNQWGANLNVDGVFGSKTEAAVKDFQSTHKLTADGIVGPKTRAILDPLGLISEAGSAPSEATTASSDAEDCIATRLLGAGLNPYGVAGVIGNLKVESGLNPKNLNGNGNKALGMSDDQYTEAVDSGAYTSDQFANDGYAYGLAQWCYPSRKANLLNFAKAAGASIGDLDMQIGFLIDELRTYKTLWPILQNASSVDEAAIAVLEMFEKPANQGEAAKEKRIAKAKETLDRMPDHGSAAIDPDGTVRMTVQDFDEVRAALSSIASILKKYE